MRSTNADDFKPGDSVTVIGGTFDLYSGTVTGREDDKILVRLVIFGRTIDHPLPFDPEDLKPTP